MKKSSILATAVMATAFTFGSASAQEATTTPVGYKKETLPAGSFNLVGITLHGATTITGAFETVAGSALTDTDTDFDSILSNTEGFLLEITSGDANGEVALLLNDNSANDNVSGNTLTASFSTTLTAGTTFRIRPSATLGSAFGTDQASLNGLVGSSSAGVADQVWVFNGTAFEKFYFFVDPFGFSPSEWRNADTEAAVNSNSVLIPYTQGVYIVTAASGDARTVTFTGEVKEGATSISLSQSFNYVGIATPIGTTLADSGLTDQVSGNASAGVADQIWIPAGSGTFTKLYYFVDPFGFAPSEWRNVSDDSPADTSINLPSAVVIVATTDKNLSVNPGF